MLWASSPRTANQVVAALEGVTEWKPKTIHTLLRRLVGKGALAFEKEGRELRLVFLHELMHLQRRDLLLSWVLVIVQAVHWFNPVVWLAFVRLRSERELACDAAVLRHLDPEDHHRYGSILIKLVEQFSTAIPHQGLLPIINNQTEIKRRILMITQFKPVSRAVTLLSGMLLTAFAVLVLTRATEKPALAAPLPERAQGGSTDRSIHALQTGLEDQARLIAEHQTRLDKLGLDLAVSGMDPNGSGAGSPEIILQRLEAQRLEASADFQRRLALYTALTNLSRGELKAAATTTVPDVLLTTLLQQEADNDQRRVEKELAFDSHHPTVQAAQKLKLTIDRQINERLDGILGGLNAQLLADKARFEILEKEVEKHRITNIEREVRRRPYLQAKRELENLQVIRDRIESRLIDEKIHRLENPSEVTTPAARGGRTRTGE